MPLSRFAVVQEHADLANRTLVHCFDGANTVLVFISREAIDDYFRRRDLTPLQRNLLIMRNLDDLAPVIAAKYERGEVNTYPSPTGRVYPQIDLTLSDLEHVPNKLTDSVLEIDARAGYGGSLPHTPPPPVEPPPPVQSASLGDGGMEAADRVVAARAPRWHPSLEPSQQTSVTPLVAGAALRDPNDRTGEVPGEAVTIVAPPGGTAMVTPQQERSPQPRSVLSAGVPQVVPPSDRGAAADPSPRPSGLEGAAAKAEAGTLTADIAVGLEGAAATTAAGGVGTAAVVAAAEDWKNVEVFVADQADAPLLEVRDGRIDLAPTTASYEVLAPRIEAARVAIRHLIAACAYGNQQHARLGDFAEQCRAALDDLKPGDPGISWYVTAQKIENYRSNYVASSQRQPDEYPPLDPALSTEIDAVVLATGMLARLFPEIAKSQDDFEKYAGRQVGVRRATRDLLNATLSDLAATEGILTPGAAAVAKTVAELDPGVTPEDAPETARTIATKTRFLRGVMSAVARVVVEQVNHLGENIRTKGLYDVVKIALTTTLGFSGILAFLNAEAHNLALLAAQWPAMFDFVQPLLRLLGII